MVFTLKELGAEAGTPEDGKARTTQGGIDEKRNKLIEAIRKHIKVYVDGIPETEPVKDADGNETGQVKRVRVNAMSNPHKDNADKRVLTLKYGNKAIIEIVDGKQSIVVDKSAEKATWNTIIDAIAATKFDDKIEKAAKEATPNTTKKK